MGGVANAIGGALGLGGGGGGLPGGGKLGGGLGGLTGKAGRIPGMLGSAGGGFMNGMLGPGMRGMGPMPFPFPGGFPGFPGFGGGGGNYNPNIWPLPQQQQPPQQAAPQQPQGVMPTLNAAPSQPTGGGGMRGFANSPFDPMQSPYGSSQYGWSQRTPWSTTPSGMQTPSGGGSVFGFDDPRVNR